MLQTLSMLIHGFSKVGKSTCAASAPQPVLILDAEGGTKFLNRKMIMWDPMKEAPPLAPVDGNWELCIVIVRDWGTVQKVFEWLTQAQHPFRSVVMDSITEIQRRCKENIGTDAMRIQDWGTLLSRMDSTIRGFRDLTLIPGNPVECVVFIAETRMKDGKYKPMMQGQIEVSLPYWVDVCGYFFAQPAVLGDGSTGSLVRQLLVSPHPQYESGERVQGRLPPVVDNPDITEMFKAIYGGNTA